MSATATDRLQARVAVLEAERDRAREECGHAKAMYASVRDELDRFLRGHADCEETRRVREQAHSNYHEAKQ
jgi:outer membrane murein-binding lipoprotein Lpp